MVDAEVGEVTSPTTWRPGNRGGVLLTDDLEPDYDSHLGWRAHRDPSEKPIRLQWTLGPSYQQLRRPLQMHPATPAARGTTMYSS